MKEFFECLQWGWFLVVIVGFWIIGQPAYWYRRWWGDDPTHCFDALRGWWCVLFNPIPWGIVTAVCIVAVGGLLYGIYDLIHCFSGGLL